MSWAELQWPQLGLKNAGQRLQDDGSGRVQGPCVHLSEGGGEEEGEGGEGEEEEGEGEEEGEEEEEEEQLIY